ncbi:hypothetical protein CXB51_004582 [Gossypium anomalum]|uniref:U-box domain-containing protein n=1 Tax=Gossypium anomalum TaxID=47600 RepID=A0A8J6DAN9_9ROSI|nr:hypothetical protein CXB51_004582 [Gossypium anomalum]
MSSEEITLQNGLNVFQADRIRAFNCGPQSATRPGPKPENSPASSTTRCSPSLPPNPPSSAPLPSSPPPPLLLPLPLTAETLQTTTVGIGREAPVVAPQTAATTNLTKTMWMMRKTRMMTATTEEMATKMIITTIITVNNTGSGNPEKMGNGKAKHSFVGGSCRGLVVKEGGIGQGVIEGNNYQNAVTIADPDGDIYYTQFLQGGEGSAASGGGNAQKDILVENGGGYGISGRKDVPFFSESGESLRAILSDPVTGALMDDAMILPCGHSFGAAGIQHVLRMKACYTCSHSVSEELVAPNLSLRAAVQAFRREEKLQFYRSPKRRRERFEQDKSSYGESNIMDPPRGRGVQFPFAVTDRVIIKGNKRTPQRFVGREAIVTTQCLNGWYVVKTLDNAESVKLQYRSLAKVAGETLSSKPMSSKMGPNWL